MRTVTPQFYSELAHFIASQYIEAPRQLVFQAQRRESHVPETKTQASPLARALAGTYEARPPTLAVAQGNDRIIVKAPGKHLKADHARLIGVQGKNFRALERILKQAASIHGDSVRLEIIDPGGAYRPVEPMLDFTPCPLERAELFRLSLRHVLNSIFEFGPLVFCATDDAATEFVIMEKIDPELLAALDQLWGAIGRLNNHQFKVFCEETKAAVNA